MLRTFFLLSLMAAPLWAQPKCGDPVKSKQFDFWVGYWAVYSNDQLVGHNDIRPLMDGCVLHENWTGKSGSEGTSLNYYDPSTGMWHQNWVWKNGTTLPKLSGGLENGAMVLKGVQKGKQGEIHHKITWTPNKDGTVRQFWEVSKDGGKTWQSSFDGLYKKAKKS